MKTLKNKGIKAVKILLMVVACFAMTTVSALGYSYTTDSYDVDVKVNKDNTYTVTEKIAVDFQVEKHGIYRYIPYGDYKDMGRMSISNVKVKDYEYDSYTEDGNKVVQIGDADVYVSGPQVYNLSYDIKIYEDRDSKRDFFYLDVIPTDWETPIESSSVTIAFPKKIDSKKLDVYLGSYGSQAKATSQWSYDKSSKTLTINAERLEQGVGITVFCELPEGYWQGEAGYGWAKTTAVALITIVSLGILALWFLFGRDQKIIPIVEFYPPEGMTPAEVGFVMDNSLDRKDLISLIMYFADKGYISIEEQGKKDFVITKLKELDGDEKNFVRTFFLGLFRKGDSVRISDLDEEFGDNYLTAYEQLIGHFKGKKKRQMSLVSGVLQVISFIMICAMEIGVLALAQWYSGAILPTLLAAVGLLGSFVALLIAVARHERVYTMKKTRKVVGGAAAWAVLIIAFALYSYAVAVMFESPWMTILFLALLCGASFATTEMRQRTKKNIELMGRLMGLKNFIEAAELDRINALVEENPNYFYNVLPYAYVMGLTDKWAKNFEHIKIKKPDWYKGGNDVDMFDVWMFSRMMNNCSRSVASNIKYTVAEDSGSSGGGFRSGGGGFSGGGFGGGGGGSW